MYKCADGDGKVSYSSLPCQGKQIEAKAFSVIAPQDDSALAAKREQQRKTNDAKVRAAKLEAERLAADSARGKPPLVNVNFTAPADRSAAEKAQWELKQAQRAYRCAVRRHESGIRDFHPAGCVAVK